MRTYLCATEGDEYAPGINAYDEEFQAMDGEDAAEMAAKKADLDGGEYAKNRVVWVKNSTTGEEVSYTVYMELCPEYTAVRNA